MTRLVGAAALAAAMFLASACGDDRSPAATTTAGLETVVLDVSGMT